MKIPVCLLGLFISTPAIAAQGYLGIVNKADGTATIVNVETSEAKVFKVGHLPHEIGFANGKAYVSNYGSAHVRSSDVRNVPGNTLTVIDLKTEKVSEVNLGAARCAPHGITSSSDGRHLYVTCEGRHEIAVVDTHSDTYSHSIPTNQAGSHLMVVSSDNKLAYVSNFWLGSVTVIDLEQRKILKQVMVGRGCEGIGISADDQSVFVTRVEDAEVIRIDTKTLQVVTRVKLADGSAPIRVVPSLQSPAQILVNDSRAGALKILNANDLSFVRQISVGPQTIGLTASATHAFSASMNQDIVGVINLKTGILEKRIPTGKSPDGIAFML